MRRCRWMRISRFRIDDYVAPNGGIIFPNPNAPTGCLLPLQAIASLLARHRQSVVVVDEAYVDFGGESAMALVNEHPNLLVVRTLSKAHSLAGLRVGYAVGQCALIEALDRVKNSFNSYPLDRLAIAGAVAAIGDQAYFDGTRQAVMRSREALCTALSGLGFEVLPSAANFVFARHRQHDAAELAAALRQRGIIVRHFKLPRIDQHLRITVGTDAQCANCSSTPCARFSLECPRVCDFEILSAALQGRRCRSALDAILGRAGVCRQPFAVGQCRRNAPQRFRCRLRNADQAAPFLEVIDAER
jgi:histidinol-phosphate/aromatic aminotransferase/cobyric acid decarboxylase-like protein